MFEHAELGHSVTKKVFSDQAPALRARLLNAQFRLGEADVPVIVLFGGVDGAGKGEVVNTLAQWLDVRRARTRAFGDPTPRDLSRPTLWRYWRSLPPRGHMAFMLSAWYHQPLIGRVLEGLSDQQYDAQLAHISAFEKTLTDDGALVLKFWLHLGKKAQKKKFQELESDPATRWRVTKRDWRNWEHYDEFVAAAERLIVKTSSTASPWHVVEGWCPRYRTLEIGTQVAEAIERHLDAREHLAAAAAAATAAAADSSAETETETETDDSPPPHRLTVLSKLKSETAPTKADYRRELEGLQSRLNLLHREARARKVPTVLVFEGWDAAGKGGAIRRVVPALDARYLHVVPVAAPTQEEQRYHYLWRFWRHLPRAGRMTIFDRSWYGRVLVERIMGYASDDEWRRAYAEINDFELQLVEYGTALVKFWLHITPEEQEARFAARAEKPYKRWKLTEEDWRNRNLWEEYEVAVDDMVKRTSTSFATWTLIEASSKYRARLQVLETVCDRLQQTLEGADTGSSPANGSKRSNSKNQKS